MRRGFWVAEKIPDTLEFEKLTLNGHVGFLSFSSSFKDQLEFCGGLTVRVPSPLVSSSFGSDPELIVFFVDLTASSVIRSLPATPGTSGTLFFVSAGFDVAFCKEESFEAQAQAGFQYGHFGGAAGLVDGFAALIGLRGALKIADGVWVTLNPQMTFANGGNRIFFLNLGIEIGF